MATPHVTGVAALYLQGDPTAAPAAVATAVKAATTQGRRPHQPHGEQRPAVQQLLSPGRAGAVRPCAVSTLGFKGSSQHLE